MDSSFFDEYYLLRNQIDKEIERFENMHEIHLQCKIGCDSCCESIGVFPIEFYAIQNELKSNTLPKKLLKHNFTKECRYLINGVCKIYNSRPFICRTQGLPLLYENFEGTGFELSVCQLNFKDVKVATFNMDNSLYMPPFNSKLYLLNRKFIDALSKQFKPTQRIKLNKL